jgi:HSP90 family molecular chaperone
MAKDENQFTFEISLSVLNHLGRNLYRSFMTVLGEAISNAWDADAENVWIYINKKNNSLVIKDDGEGMIAEDFQNKFQKGKMAQYLEEEKDLLLAEKV